VLGARREEDGLLAVRESPADGERVLWIHGYTMDSSIWDELWTHLPGFHHLAVDLPCHGASPPGPAGETLPQLGERLAAWAIARQVRHLVALSFGTMIALQMALSEPEAFAALVLAAPALAGGPTERAVERRYEDVIRVHATHGPGPHLGELWMRTPPDVFKGARQRPALWGPLSSVVLRHGWAELEDGSMLTLVGHRQRPRDLGAIDAATLVVAGDGELPAFRLCAEILARSMPRCERAALTGAGHLCLIEDPEPASRLIARHLAGQAPALRR